MSAARADEHRGSAGATRAPTMVDVALNRPARQSSVSRWSRPEALGFCTDFERNPWWEVDLGAVYLLDRIELYSQEDCEVAGSAPVSVSTSADGRTWLPVHRGPPYFGGTRTGRPLVVHLDSRVRARHVRVELRGEGALQMDEVKTYAIRELEDLDRYFADRGWGFSIPALPDFPAHERVYRRPRYYLFDDDGSGGIEVVELAEWRPFGNALRQLTNLIFIARSIGAGTVRVPPHALLTQADAAAFPDLVLETTDTAVRALSGPTLVGDFFYASETFVDMFERFGPSDHLDIVERYVSPLVLRNLGDSIQDAAQHELVVHFRGGDVLDRPDPHPGYVPPPLAYYEAALEEHSRRHASPRVIIVSQDRTNPCLAPFEESLAHRGIEYQLVSGTLEHDLGIMLGGRHLVASVGSFSRAAALLSRRIMTLYTFRLDSGTSIEMEALGEKLGAGVVDIWNTARDYIAYGDWKNTTEQRAMMLSYRSEDLMVEPAVKRSTKVAPVGARPGG